MCIYVFPTPEDNDASNPFLKKRYHASIQIDSIKNRVYYVDTYFFVNKTTDIKC